MAIMAESIGGRYEVEEVEFGRVYAWRPVGVVVECECGEASTLTRSETTCRRCGADHAGTVAAGLAGDCPADEAELHPWRHAGGREDAGLPY